MVVYANYDFSIFTLLANIPGEISRKTVALSYWKNELHEELRDVGIYSKWIFCDNSGDLRGTELNALEHLEKLRCETLYSHECSPSCKEKGNLVQQWTKDAKKYKYILLTKLYWENIGSQYTCT